MEPLSDFYNAWDFLFHHKIFQYLDESHFTVCLSVDVVKLSGETGKIDRDDQKNTVVEVWLECGPWLKPEELSEDEVKLFSLGTASHDYDLDCGAPTFEEAIIKLANLVSDKHGN